ncbi:MAG TPA: peptidylprolyl isomerase [Solirubrobacteraceae bacterium]|nr:peptidylprolyl isomerase [Solirubrobacteraceae bacterium]
MRRACLALAIVLGVAGCGSSGSTSTITSTSTAASGGAAPAACRTVAVPSPKGPPHLPPPRVKLDPTRTYTVTVVTNCGSFAFTLDVKRSPKTSASIYYLVKRGFFDGLTFHRVAAGFVIQGGDPLGNGSGGPGYTVVEAPPPGTRYVRGVVAMAKTQTDPSGASGSQFFVVTGANVGLPAQYAVAGQVVRGIAVAEKIGSLPTNPPGDGAPTPPVVMSKVTVATR